MNEIEKLLKDLTAIEERIRAVGNTTLYKGPLIDAESHIMNAKEHLRMHVRNEARRAMLNNK